MYIEHMDSSKNTLTPAVFSILLALYTEERHGYAIQKQVKADSDGKIEMGPGTLYGSIRRMLEAGLIKETIERPDPALDDERRRYYAITALGKRVLDTETQHYKRLLRACKNLDGSHHTQLYKVLLFVDSANI